MGRHYPSDAEAIRDILEIGRRMYDRGFAAANDGNISAKVSDTTLWATPTNVSKGFMTEDMLIKLDLDGNVLYGTHKPSSELQLHLAVYRENPALSGVVHAHPPVATAFSAAGIPLDTALLQEAVVLLGVIPVAPYALPGSRALAESAAALCRDYLGALLAHHGVVAWGESVMQAYFRLERIEHTATVHMHMKTLGIERPLENDIIDELIALRPAWGVEGGGRPKGRET